MISSSQAIAELFRFSRVAALGIFAGAAIVATPYIGGIGFPASAVEVPRNDLIGTTIRYRAVTSDTFVSIAKKFHLGYVELIEANPGVNPWVPDGEVLVLPDAQILPDAPRQGIVINLAELRLFFYPANGKPVQSYALGIGRDGWATPLGETTVRGKRENPTWTPPASIRAEDPTLPRVVPAGPENPLGAHAIYLGWDAYLIHGTNRPAGVGRRVSHGCIRMYAQDVDDLFRQVAVGTAVNVVDQPVKVGWRHGELFLEIHPTMAQVDALEMDGEFGPGILPDVMGLVRAAAGDDMARVDIRKVWRAALDRNGVPQKITVSDTPEA